MKESVVNLDILLSHQMKNDVNNLTVNILFNKKVISKVDMDIVLQNVVELWDDEPEVLLDILYSLKRSVTKSGGEL